MLLPDVPPSVDQGGVKGVPGGQGRYLRGPMEATGMFEDSSDDLFGSEGYLDFWQGLAGGGHQR